MKNQNLEPQFGSKGGGHLFDHALDGGDSLRWRRFPGEVLPLWLADMDFAVAEPIRQALVTRIAEQPLWYSAIDAYHNQVVADYLKQQFDWAIDPDWVLWTAGVMTGIYHSVLQLPKRAGVVHQNPLYPPLKKAAQLRQAIAAEMRHHNHGWITQWPQLQENQAQMLLLCHPHNPTGQTMTRDELVQVGDYAAKHKLLVVSDEIHAGLTLDAPHIPFAAACSHLSEQTLTFMSAGKTFNISGLATAFAVVPNRTLREQLRAQLALCGSINSAGVVATCAAFTQGEPWRKQLIAYLKDNRDLVDQTLAQIPSLTWIPNQATHLAWIDCSQVSADLLKDQAGNTLHQHLLKYGLALSEGSTFGDSNYLRLNYATSRARLRQALAVLAKCV